MEMKGQGDGVLGLMLSSSLPSIIILIVIIVIQGIEVGALLSAFFDYIYTNIGLATKFVQVFP